LEQKYDEQFRVVFEAIRELMAPEPVPPARRIGLLISSAGAAERNVYLQETLNDRPNGFYDRSLHVGSIPVDVRVPRSRNGDFRPTSLPAPYRRGYTEEVQSLLLGLLASSRSVNAAKDALQKMGLTRSEQDLERVAVGLIEELELRNSRPIHPDMLALFLDGKYIELREGDKLRSACIYIVVGLGSDGKKQVLACACPGMATGRQKLAVTKLEIPETRQNSISIGLHIREARARTV